MAVLGRIRDGLSAWSWIPIKYMMYSYYEDNELKDVIIESLFEESYIKWRREEDCWIFEGFCKFFEKDFVKFISYCGRNFESWSEKNDLYRIQVWFDTNFLLFIRTNSDILDMGLRSDGGWDKETMSFVHTISFWVYLKRDADFSEIWKTI